MMKGLIVRCMAIPFFMITDLGCSSGSDKKSPLQNSIAIEQINPKRIRFVVQGDPGLDRYPDILELPIPMHEKIREGMRRYASDELRERSLCPRGFNGPEIVWIREASRQVRYFFVDCI